MWSYEAEGFVAGDPSAVRTAIAGLIATLWGGRSWTLADTAAERIDAVSTEPGHEHADVWLTWGLREGVGGIQVTVRLDELERGPDASAELHRLLAMLGERLRLRT